MSCVSHVSWCTNCQAIEGTDCLWTGAIWWKCLLTWCCQTLTVTVCHWQKQEHLENVTFTVSFKKNTVIPLHEAKTKKKNMSLPKIKSILSYTVSNCQLVVIWIWYNMYIMCAKFSGMENTVCIGGERFKYVSCSFMWRWTLCDDERKVG